MWLWQQRSIRERQLLWAKLFLISFSFHFVFFIWLFFLYHEASFDIAITVESKLFRPGAPVIFVPFKQKETVRAQNNNSLAKRPLSVVKQKEPKTSIQKRKENKVKAKKEQTKKPPEKKGAVKNKDKTSKLVEKKKASTEQIKTKKDSKKQTNKTCALYFIIKLIPSFCFNLSKIHFKFIPTYCLNVIVNDFPLLHDGIFIVYNAERAATSYIKIPED